MGSVQPHTWRHSSSQAGFGRWGHRSAAAVLHVPRDAVGPGAVWECWELRQSPFIQQKFAVRLSLEGNPPKKTPTLLSVVRTQNSLELFSLWAFGQ